MNKAQRQIIAEKVASTVRVLELLCLEYEVKPPRNIREKGNRCPRIVHVSDGDTPLLRVYNGMGGNTWAHEADGTPIPEVKSIEDLYTYLRVRGRAQQAAARDRVKKRGA